MKRITINCFLAAMWVLVPGALAQNFSGVAVLNNSTSTTTKPGPVTETNYTQPILIGSYAPDGKFQVAKNDSPHYLFDPDKNVPRPVDGPLATHLISDERVVENFAPPARATMQKKGHHPLLVAFRDSLMTWAYGHARVLQNPTHVVTDSHGRLIVSDPQSQAVHVLDPNGQSSFRILGGPMRRLFAPGPIAIDAGDNIYVADAVLNLISVYAGDGRFLHYLGNNRGESMFEAVGGMTIDQRTGRIYLLDTPADELVVMDLEGNVLARAGNSHTRSKLRLKHPTEIAIWKDEVVVLDNYGSRIAILNSGLEELKSFGVLVPDAPPAAREVGLALDQHGNIYLSNLLNATLRVYAHDGQFVSSLGRQNVMPAFNSILGIWIDPADRLFVCDSLHSRVQIFQIGSTSGAEPAARD